MGKIYEHTRTGKVLLRKFRFYPRFLLSRMDKWLSKMSADGWHVIYVGMLRFVFEKGVPENKLYFSYLDDYPYSSMYSMPRSVYSFVRKYRVSKKKSKVNLNTERLKCYYKVTELDLEKLDPNTNEEYKDFVRARDDLYGFAAMQRLCFFLICVTLVLFSLWLNRG